MMPKEANRSGLTDFGVQVVKRMNEVGMLSRCFSFK